MAISSRAFSISFLALLAAIGTADLIRHAFAVSRDPRRIPSERGTDSAGIILGPLRGNLSQIVEEPGDLSLVGRLLPFRRIHRERFSTDPFGYRNPGFRPDGRYDAVIIGDCFLDGDDSELFHSRLEDESGLKVYNYHGMRNLGMKARDFLADDRLMQSPLRYLIVERVERGFNAHWIRQFMAPRHASPPGNPAKERMEHWADVSRHSLVKEAMQWTVSTARYQIAGRLPSSVPVLAPDLGMLFFNEETLEHALSPAERGIPEVLDSLQALDSLCRLRNIRLVVLMVPDKYSVYGWKAAGPKPPDRGAESLVAVAQGLESRGILFVDIFGEFRERAQDLDSLLYYRDDTRWTPHGRRAASREFARSLDRFPWGGSQ